MAENSLVAIARKGVEPGLIRTLAAKSFGLTEIAAWRQFFPSSSYSGQTVSAQTALQLATVWACVRLISETIATLPLFVYRRDSNGRTIAPEHSLYPLLHDQPNANMTAAEFWEAVVAQLCLWGNFYGAKSYSAGVLVAIEPMWPQLMRVHIDKFGALLYCYSDPKGYKEYTEDEIFHVKGFGIDGLIGLSPVSYARNTLGGAMAADEASSRMFSNGMRAGGALSVPQLLNQEQRKAIGDRLAEQVAGVAKTGGMIVLEGGMTYTPLSMNPDDAQMLQTRAFNVEEICRWFRVPPFMVGHSEKSTSWGTGLEQQMLGFLTFALRPYLTRIEQSIKKSLLTPVERRKFYAEFAVEGLLRADSTARANLYATGLQNGWITPNEVREYENMPPEDGGGVLRCQSNMIPLSMLGQTTTMAANSAQSALKSWLGLPDFGESQ